MSAAAQQGQATRARLLAAAVDLIGEVGWGAVTTRNVAARAGVPAGAVHYHFASVAELRVEAVITYAELAVNAPLATLRAAPDLATGLRQLLAAIDAFAGNPAGVLLAEAALAATRERHLQARLYELISRFRTEVADWLRRQGRTDDAELTAAALAALLDGLILQRAIDPSLRAVDLTGPILRLVGVSRPEDDENDNAAATEVSA